MKELGIQSENPSDGAIYDIKQLGISKTLLLGIQHTFAMFGATVLVPILTGLSISTTLLMAGLGTLLFHLITKGKVPAFLGSSFAFLGGYSAVKAMDFGEGVNALPYACGGVFIAGLVYVVVAALVKVFGAKKVMKFFPPVVTGPIIIAIGLILAPSAINNCKTDWLLAIIAIAIVIVCNIWGKGMVKIIPIMLGVVGTYVIAIILAKYGHGTIDYATIRNAAWVGLPLKTSEFMKFDVSAIVAVVPISLATMMEHIGDISAIGATTGKNYIADPGLHRTLLGDGLATSLSAAFGGPANTTYGENTGVLELSHVYDPLVIRIAACLAIIISFIPKVSAIISTMPSAIIGGVSFMLYGMISAIGVRNVVENKVDLTKSRNLIITGVIFVCGLGFGDGLTFTVAGTSITLTALSIAAIAGILLNIILPGNDYEFDESSDL